MNTNTIFFYCSVSSHWCCWASWHGSTPRNAARMPSSPKRHSARSVSSSATHNCHSCSDPRHDKRRKTLPAPAAPLPLQLDRSPLLPRHRQLDGCTVAPAGPCRRHPSLSAHLPAIHLSNICAGGSCSQGERNNKELQRPSENDPAS